MALSDKELSGVAQRLLEAARDTKPIDPVTQSYPEITIHEAYRIQALTIDARLSEGRKVIGKKIGLTSPAMQEMFGVDEPDYGHLLDDMLVYEGVGLDTSQLLQPRVEGEIAFVLEKDLRGPGITPTDVIRSTAGVMAALEIIDSRIRDWKIKIQDTVADNASSAGIVLGTRLVPLGGLDLRRVGFVMTKNERLAVAGAGAAVLGSPVQSVAWLANRLADYGISLKRGETILSGTPTAAVPVEAGDAIHLTVDRIGDVGCFFT